MKWQDFLRISWATVRALPYAAVIAVALPIAIVVETVKNEWRRRRAREQK